MTDVSTTWAEVIFRVKWIVFVNLWSCQQSLVGFDTEPTTDCWQTSHEPMWPIIFNNNLYNNNLWLTIYIYSTNQTYNTIDWQRLFTWLWGWLPLSLSKRQSPTTVFRTTFTRSITLCALNCSVFPSSPRPSKNCFGKFMVCSCLLCFALGIREPSLLSSFHQ